ncbi:MAG TPA: hypothetical protein VII56_02920 [Rhizomicrobium sp.]
MARNAAAAFVAALALGSLVPAQAFAWGSTGHRMIGELAAQNLPDEMPAFLRTPDAVAQIGELAREPDRSRGSGTVHDAERDPGHFVDASDDLTVLGGPSLKALPPTRSDYDTALRAAGATQYKAGYLPYSIIDGWQQLRTDLAYWRIDTAGEKFAKTDAARDWFAADRRLREMLTIRDFGVWAHYVGDASQPLHVSVHYDVWGDFPNPEGFSTVKGLHARFEGHFVNANIAESDLSPLLAPTRDCACAIEVRTADYLVASQAFVVPLFRLEKAHAFDGNSPDGKAFVAARLAAGASELRDMALDAWHASADVRLGYPPLSVKDIEAGTVDALAMMQGAE